MKAMHRRRWLLASAAASLAGGGLLWYRTRDSLWNLEWPQPQGGTLALRAWRGRWLLLNFWATWCAPCREELPLLNHFYRQHQPQGWGVLALALDDLATVQAFLKKTPLALPVGVAGASGSALLRQLGNGNAGLPFSVVFNPDGQIVQRKLGRLHAAELERWGRLQ